MAKELNEDTAVQISIKTLAGIAVLMAAVISGWFVLQSDIAEAMGEDELFRLKVVNKALTRENKQLKEQVRIMGEAGVNKAKEKEDAKSR